MTAIKERELPALAIPGTGSGSEAPRRSDTKATAAVDDDFNRPPRIHRHLPTEEVTIPPPPAPQEEPDGTSIIAIMMTSGGMLALAFVYLLSGSGGFIVGLLVMPLFLIGGQLYMRRDQRSKFKRKELEVARRYNSTLDEIGAELDALRHQQQEVRRANDPPLSELLNVVLQRSRPLWERRPTDPDFLCLRLGIGTRQSSVPLKLPERTEVSPLLDRALMIGHEYRTVPEVPLTADLPTIGSLGVAGPRYAAVALVRSLICQLVANHSPREVKIVAFLPSPPHDKDSGKPNLALQDWDWLKWLPHIHTEDGSSWLVALDDHEVEKQMSWVLDQLSQRAGQAERIQAGQAQVDDEAATEAPYLILLLDKASDQRLREQLAFAQVLGHGCELRAAAICLVEQADDVPSECGAIAEVLDDGTLRYSVAGVDGYVTDGQADAAEMNICKEIAEALAPLSIVSSEGQGSLRTGMRLLDLLWPDANVAADKVDPSEWWRRTRQGFAARYGWLRVPLGELRKQDPMYIDLRGSGDERGGSQTIHDGPHGLIAGTSGSGKSELLQTLVAALALTHHPNAVNFLLVDYKGGSSLEYFKNLPHTVGVVTNLNGSLAQRALDALRAELNRRQDIIVRYGKSDIAGYEQQRAATGKGEQLADLFIIVDEFAELVVNLPSFVEQLISVARLGRSLGVHLILATQKPSGSVNVNIQANMNFRICLRVQSTDDSREMLARPDAAYLSNQTPGRAYYMLGSDRFELFQTARIAGPFSAERGHRNEIVLDDFYIDHLYPRPQSKVTANASGEEVEARVSSTELEKIIERLSELADTLKITRSPSPYPPPLLNHLSLAEALSFAGSDELTQLAAQLNSFSDAAADAATKGQPSPAWQWLRLSESRWLQADIGLVDEPRAQRQRPLRINLSQTGNLMVVGVSGAGKATLLHTLTTALAITHPPDQLWLYGIDFGGRLDWLRALPHTGEVLGPRNGEKIKRLLRWLGEEIEERKLLFARNQVSDLRAYRAKGLTGLPAVVTLIYNFASFRQAYDSELDGLAAIMREGRTYGIHIVIAADRPGAIPGNIASSIGERLALRLSDDGDSMIVVDKDYAANLGVEQVGRGYQRTATLPLEFQVALSFANPEGVELDAVSRMLAQAMQQSWKEANGKAPYRIELLPPQIPLRELRSPDAANAWQTPGDGLISLIGRDDYRLQPVSVNLSRQGPHFLIAGAAETGRTNLLLCWLLGLAERYSPDALNCYLVDFKRRGLRLSALANLPHVQPLTIDEHPIRSVRNAAQMEALVRMLEQAVAERSSLVSDDDEDETLITRLKSLPELLVVIDDYEYVLNDMGWASGAVRNPLAQIAQRAGDLGIHFMIAGTASELRRGSGDPLLMKLKSLRSGVLLRINDTADAADLFGMMMRQPPAEVIAGRGYFVAGSSVRPIQAAWLNPGDEGKPGEASEWVARLVERAKSTPAP